LVAKDRIADGNEYNLSGERYRQGEARQSTFPFVELGSVATLLNGRAYKREELLDEGPVPVLRVGNFFSNRGWFYSDLQLDADKYCEAGDLLFAWSASFGPRIWDGPKAIYHYHIWKVVPSSEVDKHYLFWILKSEAEQIKSEGHGIAMVHATKSGMEKRKIPLPPLEVQREIVAEIEGYQKVIDGARTVLENYRPHIPIDPAWPIEKMGDLCVTISDGDHQPPPKSEEGIPFITISNLDEITGVSFDKTFFVPQAYYDALKDHRKPKLGDILYSVTGSYGVAVTVTSERPFCFQRHVALLRPSEKVLPNYLLAILRSPYGKHQGDAAATGVAQKTVSLTSLREFKIPLPPLETQQAIVAEIEAEQALVEANRQLIEGFEKKIEAAIARVWGGADEASAA